MKTTLSLFIVFATFLNTMGQVTLSADSAYVELETGKKKEVDIKVTNSGTSKIKVKWEIIQDELKGTSGWDVEFCDCLECRVVYPTSGGCDTTGIDNTDFGYIFAVYVTDNNGNFANKKMKVKVTNVDDSTDFKVMTFMTRKATGNEELVKDEDKNNLYPNPSTGLTKLQLVSSTRGETLIELIDLSGSVIKSEMANIEVGINEIQLNYSNLEKGVYFIRYQNGNVTETKKFTLR